jgi:hypothetical protein
MTMKRMLDVTTAAMVLLGASTLALAQNTDPDNKQVPTQPAADASQAATPAPSGKAPGSQPPAATPADPVKADPVKEVSIDVVIAGIDAAKGRKPKVGYRYSDKEEWKVAKIGDKFREGVCIQVCFYTSVHMLIGDGQHLDFNNPGIYTVTEAYNDGKTDISRITMPEGKITFNVKKIRYANDVVITTPDMTLAIKGTVGGIQCTPGQPTLAFGDVQNRGRIELTQRGTQLKTVMTRNERSDSVNFDPAARLARASAVETATDLAREGNESHIMKRTEGSTQAVFDIGEIKGAGLRLDLMTNMKMQPGPGVGTHR